MSVRPSAPYALDRSWTDSSNLGHKTTLNNASTQLTVCKTLNYVVFLLIFTACVLSIVGN